MRLLLSGSHESSRSNEKRRSKLKRSRQYRREDSSVPNKTGSSRDIRKTLSGLSFVGKVDLKINGDQDDLEEILDDYLQVRPSKT